jgi:prepilin-type N-terminal cleavage/methylation domain-containing protein
MLVKGFSLVEVLVAMALVATCAAGLADLFVLSSRVTSASRVETVETMAALGKMAELRSLTWAYDAGGTGAPVSDPGLSISPASSLAVSADGFADYLDAGGAVIGHGIRPPAQGVYLRRWSIQPLPNDGSALVLQVVATRVTLPQSRDVHLISILARTSQ